MKNKIYVLAIMALLLLSYVAYAETLAERDRAARERYNNAKSEYRQAVNFYKNARADYKDAREKYKKYRTGQYANLTIEKARDYILKVDNAMTSYLTMIKRKAETSPWITEEERQKILNEVNADIAWLEQQIPLIESATTKGELVTHANKIKEHWMRVRIHAKRLILEIMIRNTDRILARAEEFSTNVTTKIEELNAQDIDTTRLQAWLDDFNKKLVIANQKQDTAIARANEIGIAGAATAAELDAELREANRLFKDAHNFIKEANRYVRDAYKDLKEIVKEIRAIKRQKTGETTVSGTGRLTASGSGTAVIEGNGEVSGSTDVNGTVKVTDSAGDVSVTTSGTGTVTDEDERTKVYSGYGSLTIKGTNVRVEAEGTDVEFTAKGTGTATLTGTGTYTTSKTSGDWTEEGVTVTIE
ncbi:hypothetical protein HYW99_01505 [Candidatus Woesearchaeota archaeon]|nr:hypothetical protein [Candidatus Woesearchaeota archaeon]